ncbi:MAG: B12-binding domain-containing radical SAM protein [Candidatus Omnitrophica bacterium]|nr:B12-binding domain-containing radical SAM protein [Candidatus Omnitrophota bacterium]
MSTILRDKGHETSVIYFRDLHSFNDTQGQGDPNGFHNPPGSVHSRDIEALIGHLRDLQPTLVGFSFMSNFHGLAIFLTQRLKKEFPGVPVIWGGSDPTVNPDQGIQHADFVCQGEGEEAILELTEALAAGTSTDSIQNIWAKTPDGHKPNPPRSSEKDLDQYPYTDFDQTNKWYLHDGVLEFGVYPPKSHLHRNYPTLTSRGCPYNCSFCCNSNYRELYGPAKYVRRHSVEYVMKELEHRKETFPGLGFIEFWDDVFTFKSDWLHEFAREYKRRINLPFFAYTHPQMCKDEDLRVLREAGWEQTIMGVQSGSEEILQMYDRNMARQRMIDSAHLLNNIGVDLIVDLIGNNPMEDEQTMRETFEMLLEFPEDFVMHEVNPLAMYRNFPITRVAESRGLLGPMLEGRNAWLAEDKPEYHFWTAMWTLTQFNALPRDTLRSMADDPYLREHPEVVEGIMQGFLKSSFMNGTYVKKDRKIQEMEEEQSRLNGSRLIRLARRLRDAKNTFVRSRSNANGRVRTQQPETVGS